MRVTPVEQRHFYFPFSSRFLLTVGFFFFLFILASHSTSHAVLEVNAVTAVKTKVPRSSQVDMLYFQLRATGQDEIITKVTFRNNAAISHFGTGVKRAFLYHDVNSNGAFDIGEETQLDSNVYNTETLVDQQFDLAFTITSGNIQGFFISYEIASDAALSTTTNLKLLDVNDANLSLGGFTSDHTVQITGFQTATASDESPTIVIPGQEKIGMLKLTVNTSGEDVFENINITIQDIQGNFITETGQTNGITKAYLYNAAGFSSFDPEFVTDAFLIQSVVPGQASGGQFVSNTELRFEFPLSTSGLNFTEGTTVNMFVVYDIGDEISITNDTKVAAQLVSITGQGNESGLTLSATEKRPTAPAEAQLAGLSYHDLSNDVIPANSLFGKGTVAPILRFTLKANHTDIDVGKVTIKNPGTTSFITSQFEEDGVRKISLFEDVDSNLSFSGFDSVDTLIGELDLGVTGINPGPGNTSDTAIIDLSPSLNLGIDDEKTIFVVYHFGVNISEAEDASGNLTSVAIAQLQDATGSANVSGLDVLDVSLSGAKPASANPEAQINLGNPNVQIVAVDDISPVSAIQGERLVPMLAVTLNSDITVASSSFLISNEIKTFFPNNTGVSKVWVFEDVTPNKRLDNTDTLLGATVTLDQTGIATISGVPLSPGHNHLLVLYDIGQVAATTEKSARAQMFNVTGTSPVIFFGGQVPNPEISAKLDVKPKTLEINLIETNASQIADLSGSFNIRIIVKNISTQNVTLQSIFPKIFLSTASGKDITSEFNFIPLQSVANTLVAPGASEITNFDVRHVNRVSEGTAIIDGFVKYTASSQTYAVLERYVGASQWFPAYSNPPLINIESDDNTHYSWTLPQYIDSIEIETGGGGLTPFFNNDAIAANSAMRITLKNPDSINQNEISLVLNGTSLENVSTTGGSSNPFTYSYDPSIGRIRVTNLGTSDGTLVLSVASQPTPLPDANIQFIISDDIRIENVLPYPSPYRIGSTPLLIGFNLTKPATVNLYMYNHLGVQVWHHEETFLTLGYHHVSIDEFSDFLKSGMYFFRVIATRDGVDAVATTRLAIY